jgi:hypothetical protein
MQYKWKSGAYVNVSAQVAGEVCAELEQSGGLTPKRLVDVSRDPSAPLHKNFEWDDSVAAENYREQQARHIIACIVTKPTEKSEPIRAFYNITRQEGEYVSLSVIISQPDMMERLLSQAYKDMESFKSKYSALEQLRVVIEAMESVSQTAQ